MLSAFQQHHRAAKPPRDHGQERTAEARTNDRDVKLRAHSPHSSHAVLEMISCLKFICSSLARRALKHPPQVENFSKSHRSAKARPRRNSIAYSSAASKLDSFGGANCPCSASVSSAPF